jgi:MYXO-CTERM domain-containing protein
VNQYLALTPPPTVYVMTPPPASFVYQSAAEQTFASDVVKPAVLAVAAATANVHVIDLFSDAGLATGAGDGHFTVAEHAAVAQLVYDAIKGSPAGSGGAGGGGGAAGMTSGGATNGGASGAAAGSASVGGAGLGGASGAETGGTSAAGAAIGGSAGATVASAGSVATAGSAAIAGSAGAALVGGSVGSPSSQPASSADSSGCSIVAHSTTRSPAGWLALLGGALLLGRCRRRSGPAA